MSAAIDHEARTAAALANQKIDAHEDKCAERWRQARDAQRETAEAVKGLYKRCWWFAGLIIAGQGAVIVALLKAP